MVTDAVTGLDPDIDGGWVVEQAGASLAPDGAVTAHLRATAPVKPPLGVTVTVEVVEPPAEMAAGGVALNENIGVDTGSMA